MSHGDSTPCTFWAPLHIWMSTHRLGSKNIILKNRIINSRAVRKRQNGPWISVSGFLSGILNFLKLWAKFYEYVLMGIFFPLKWGSVHFLRYSTWTANWSCPASLQGMTWSCLCSLDIHWPSPRAATSGRRRRQRMQGQAPLLPSHFSKHSCLFFCCCFYSHWNSFTPLKCWRNKHEKIRVGLPSWSGPLALTSTFTIVPRYLVPE